VILREVKLILLILALCTLAALGITFAYTHMSGLAERVVPLLIVILLIAVAISALEGLTNERESRAKDAMLGIPLVATHESGAPVARTANPLLAVLLLAMALVPFLTQVLPLPVRDYLNVIFR
jgi:hypothetical protein